MHKKEIFVTKKGYIFSDCKKLPKKCSKDHKLPKKCSKTEVAQKLLERPKVAKKLPSNLCKSLALAGRPICLRNFKDFSESFGNLRKYQEVDL